MKGNDKGERLSLVRVLTSMRLTIFVLVILAVGSIGAIIFQEYHPTNIYDWQAYYLEKLGPFKYKLYSFFQLFTPYRSWWYTGLLGLLCVSLSLCSIKRLRGVLKMILKRSDFRFPEKLSRQSNFTSLRMPAGTGARLIRDTLRRKFYRVYTRTEFDKTYVYAKKGSLSRLGPFLSHIGLLLLFAGGVIAATTGKSEMIWIAPGDTKKASFADHQVHVEDFTILYNEEGRVKDYISYVKVLDDDEKEILTKKVEVNGPLRYHGVSYYQSSYRLHPRRIKHALLVLTRPGGNGADTLLVPFGRKVMLGEGEYSLALADFAADFQITQRGVRSKSDELNNPAILVCYYRGDEELGHQWLFAKFPPMHSQEDMPFRAELVRFDPLYLTGLQATTNPGSPLIWSGFIVMTLGLLLVFYLNHRQVWAAIVRLPGGTEEVFIAGTAHKFRDEFRKDLREMVAAAKALARHETASRSSSNAPASEAKAARKEQSCNR